jgi:hypothetical protein
MGNPGSKGAITWKNNEVRINFASLFDTVFLAGAVERPASRTSTWTVAGRGALGTLAAFREAIESGQCGN